MTAMEAMEAIEEAGDEWNRIKFVAQTAVMLADGKAEREKRIREYGTVGEAAIFLAANAIGYHANGAVLTHSRTGEEMK